MKSISEQGIKMIKQLEGWRGKAYKCTENRWTIGYGFTEGVKEGDTITREQSDILIRKTIRSREASVNALVYRELTQNQFDAVVSMVYRIGHGHFNSSTLKKQLNTNPNNEEAVREAWLMWDGKGDISIEALKNRMEIELKHYFSK